MATKPYHGELEQRVREIEKKAEKNKKIEQGLANTNELLEYMLNVSPVILYRCELREPYPATFMSKNIKHQLGYEPNDFTDDPQFWASHIHPDDAERILSQLPNLFKKNYHTHEYRFLHKDGTYRWMRDDLRLLRDADGKPIDIIGSLIDITERKQAEQARKRSEKILSSTFNTLQDLLIVIDRDLRVIMSNWRDHDYISEKERQGNPYCYKCFMHSDTHCEPCHALEVFASGKVKELEHTNPVDGKTREIRVFPMFDDDGNVNMVVEHIRNITERKQAEKALLLSKKRLNAIKQIGALANSTLDLDTVLKNILRGTLEATSASVGMIFIKDLETLQLHWGASIGLSEAFVTEFRDRHIQPVEGLTGRIAQTGESIYIPTDSSHDKRIARPVVMAEGLNSFIGVPIYAADEIIGVINILTRPPEILNKDEITLCSAIGVHVGSAIRNAQFFEQLKQAKMALKKSEELYRTLVENINMGITLIDKDHTVVMTNIGQGKLLNKNVNEFIGKKCFQEFEKRDEICPHCPGVIAMNTRQTAEVQAVGVRDDGSKVDVRIFAFPILGTNNNVEGFIEVVEDITNKKKLEAQLQKAQKIEAIGTLAGGLAHDFNNLLMSIQGNASLILMDIDSYHPHYERLKDIEKQVQSGAALTKQLLGYASKGRYEVKPINLNQIVEEISMIFGRTRKQITIQKNMAEDLFAIEADQEQIKQVLLNLFINASDAMPGGGGNLYLKTDNVSNKDLKNKSYKSKAGNYVKLSVRDTGIGMDKDTMERIFDPFFTTKEMGRGTGLGLASVYGIIKAHGGYIDVESEFNHGTTFEIYLPATTQKVGRETKDSEKLDKQTGTVLLVDDEAAVLKVCMSILRKTGYKVFSAKDGKEAIEIYKKNQNNIDIVLLDMIMPNMSGGEVYDRLKEINPDIKVLLSSGYSLDGEANEILNRGCNGFIQKPFSINELSVKIRGLLEKK